MIGLAEAQHRKPSINSTEFVVANRVRPIAAASLSETSVPEDTSFAWFVAAEGQNTRTRPTFHLLPSSDHPRLPFRISSAVLPAIVSSRLEPLGSFNHPLHGWSRQFNRLRFRRSFGRQNSRWLRRLCRFGGRRQYYTHRNQLLGTDRRLITGRLPDS